MELNTVLYIVKQYNIPEIFIIKNPTFIPYFLNWYFAEHHCWEWVPIEYSEYDSDLDLEIKWHISCETILPFENSYRSRPLVDLFEDGYISDTGSDYSLYIYNSD